MFLTRQKDRLSMATDKLKVAILTDIMSPYRIPLFNEMARQALFELRVIFFARMAGGRKWDIDHKSIHFEYSVVGGIGLPVRDRFPAFFNPQLFQVLHKFGPDVIICNGYH